MDCSDFEELLSARRDGELTPAEAVALERHLQGCPACRKTAQVIDEIGALVASLDRAPMPRETEKAILSDTLGHHATAADAKGFLSGYYRVPRPLAWAAVIVFVALGVENLVGPAGNILRPGDRGANPANPGVQKVVMTDDDLVFINGTPVQKVTISDNDIIMTRTMSGKQGKL